MATDKQTAANRRNAKKSTGPRSPQGKTVAAQNALTYGLYTKHFVILPTEDADQFAALLAGYSREFQPATPCERQIVREMAESQWRLARVGRLETEYLIQAGDDPNPDVLIKWDRLTNSARRAYRSALKDLFDLRDRRDYHLALSPDPGFEEPGTGYDYEFPPPPPPVSNEPNSAEPKPPEPVKVPYDFAMELKELKRFQPQFDPRHSQKMSPRLTQYCKDPDNLQAVVKLMYTI